MRNSANLLSEDNGCSPDEKTVSVILVLSWPLFLLHVLALGFLLSFCRSPNLCFVCLFHVQVIGSAMALNSLPICI